MKKTTRQPTTAARLNFEGGAGLENVKPEDIGPEPSEAEEKKIPLPKWRNDRAMLDWLCGKLDFDDALYREWVESGEALDMVRDPEKHAIYELELRGERDRLIAILEAGKASVDLQRYLAKLLRDEPAVKEENKKPNPLFSNKSLAERRSGLVQSAAQDVPRIMRLWKKFFEKEVRLEERSWVRDQACNMAVRRAVRGRAALTKWRRTHGHVEPIFAEAEINEDDQDAIATLATRVSKLLDRGPRNRRRV